MRFNVPVLRRCGEVCLVLLLASATQAGPPSDVLLPRTTKGYVSVAQPVQFEERWNETQLGLLLDDEAMQPFVEDLRKQLQEKYLAVEEKLGITWDDLEGVPAGEMSLSLIERQGEPAALAITIDVAGHEEQVDRLLAAVEQRFAARGGTRVADDSNGTKLEIFAIPGDEGSPPQTTVYFIKDNVLVGIDDRSEAGAILKRFAGNSNDNLRSVRAYMATMERCRQQAEGLAPEVRWFVEPFGFIFASRTLQKTTVRPNEQDIAQILSDTGFNAIEGAGGFFHQLVSGQVEYLHRAAIYAPPVPGKEDDPLRWNLSMRMLQLPNASSLEPQPWVPRTSANYTTFQLELDKAFDHVGPVFDAIQGHEDAWVNSLEGWETDAYGPKVNVREEFIANMGQRITLIASYHEPITVDSERSVVAIEATNEKSLAEALEKWMSKEPDVVRRQFGPFVIWERVPAAVAVRNPAVEPPPGFEVIRSESPEEAKEEEEKLQQVLPNSAVCVALGHMFMSSDVQYLQKILKGFAEPDRLASSADYQSVVELMEQLAPGERSGWSFGRTDEELRPTFELLRQGKMPQAETMLAKFLNNLLTTETEREDGTIRKQRIDGSSLPPFDAVRHYFGPAGRVIQSERDGWFVTVAVLNEEGR